MIAFNKKLPSENETNLPSVNEWNFDGVSEDELVACCYWEYARESEYIRERHQTHQELVRKQGYGLTVWGALPQHHGGISNAFLRPQDQAFISDSNFPAPWMNLKCKPKTDIRDIEWTPLARGDWSEVRVLAHIYGEWEREMLRLGNPESLNAPKLPAVARCPYHVGGAESCVVRINWGHFTNDELAAAFRKWVKANRPKDIPKPNKQGHKDISYRVDLEHLAIMRLLRCFSLAELRKQCPEAWKRYNNPNRRWQRDAEKARARFHSLFPFLSAKENPISWPPKSSAQQPA